MPAPPVPLDQHPVQFAEGGYYFVVHRENSLNWRSMAAYDFGERRWRKLPTPPDLRGPSRAWDGENLVLVGLRGCPEEQGIRCTEGIPTAAFIEPSNGEWRIVDLGMGRIDVSPEGGWGMHAFAGSNGRTYLTDEANHVVWLEQTGELVQGPALPPGTMGGPCIVGNSLIAVGSASADWATKPFTPTDARMGLLHVRLTSHVWRRAPRKDVHRAQEVPARVQA